MVLDRHPRKPLRGPEREVKVGLVLELPDLLKLGLVGPAPLPLGPELFSLPVKIDIRTEGWTIRVR